jgi:hypothetical protein
MLTAQAVFSGLAARPGCPGRTNHSVYFGLATIYFRQPFRVVDAVSAPIDTPCRTQTPQIFAARDGGCASSCSVGASRGPAAVRAGRTTEGWRCYSLAPASGDKTAVHLDSSRRRVDSHHWHIAMRGYPFCSGTGDADPSRLNRLEEPSPKSNRPLTSPVAAQAPRFAGSMPIRSCAAHAFLLTGFAYVPFHLLGQDRRSSAP